MTDFRTITATGRLNSFFSGTCFMMRSDSSPEVITANCFRPSKGRFFVTFISGSDQVIAFSEVMLFGKCNSKSMEIKYINHHHRHHHNHHHHHHHHHHDSYSRASWLIRYLDENHMPM